MLMMKEELISRLTFLFTIDNEIFSYCSAVEKRIDYVKLKENVFLMKKFQIYLLK